MKVTVNGKSYTVGNKYIIPAWVYDKDNNRKNQKVSGRLELLSYYDGESYIDAIHFGFVFTWWTTFKGTQHLQRMTMPDGLGIDNDKARFKIEL